MVMRLVSIAILISSTFLMSISPYTEVDVFGVKFKGNVYRLLESFVRHTNYYGWFLKNGLKDLSTEAMLKAAFWVEYVCYYYGASYRESYEIVVPLALMGNVVDMPAMVSIAVVETKFRNIVGDEGKAMGYFQIHLDTAINALEFVNRRFPEVIWKLPLKDSLMTIIKDLIQRPTYYKSNPDVFKKIFLKNRPLQSVVASLIYLHKAFMAGDSSIKTDPMTRPIPTGENLVLDLSKSAPAYWNSANWIHYAPRFYYHYSKALTAYTMFLKVYMNVETVEDLKGVLKTIDEWRNERDH